MDNRMVYWGQHMPCLIYPHPLLHEGIAKLVATIVYDSSAHRSPAYNPHFRERCCMLYPCIPPPHIRQASHGGHFGLHPCNAAAIGSVGIRRELHVGWEHRTDMGRDMGVSAILRNDE